MTFVRRSQLGIAVASVLCCALVAAIAVPLTSYVPKEELVKTSLWGVAVLGAFAGCGTVLAKLCWRDQKVSLGLRTVWGASMFTFAGGALAAIDTLSRAFLYGIVVVGCTLLMHAWIRDRAGLADALRVRLRVAKAYPVMTLCALFVALGVALHYVGGAADTSSSPYDDDISYYPFAKQLLEHGTLIDPFSFRRMSTLGGQALYHAVLLLRVPVLHLNVFDRGMCVLLASLLLLSHRLRGSQIPFLARLVSVVVLVALPNTSINSASHYSGLAFFLALFQTKELMPEGIAGDVRAALRRTLPLALTGAALCTLRQNYQVVVAAFVFFSYGFALVGKGRNEFVRQRFVEPATALVLTGVLVLPWLFLSYRSNQTFLFPLMKGTFRAGVEVRSQAMTVGKFLRFFVDVWLQIEPLRTLPLFFFVGLAVRERGRSPLASLWLSGLVGFCLLAWGFSLSDAENLSRYAFGFFTAAALLTWQRVAARAYRPTIASGGAPALQGAILVAALVFTLQSHAEPTRKMLETRIADVDEMLRRSVPMQAEPPIAAVYRRIQNATPAGARLLVMLDQPYHLDFGRNEIWNLDMPGTASPAPDIPCFRGPDVVAEYFAAKQIRYVAFVESSRSTFLYRRDVWVDHVWDRDEIWRTYAPYMVDVMDNLAALAQTRRHLHEEAGMILLDLQAER